MAHRIDYGTLMHDAMRGLIRRVLTDVAENGLPGEHHFFITLDTRHPGVGMAGWLHERYPEEITIVIQNWYDGLEVDEDGFTITLNFGNRPEPLVIPFAAIRTFVDPSVEFGLRFETQEEAEEAGEMADDESEAAEPDPEAGEEDDTRPEADVVSIDSFRK